MLKLSTNLIKSEILHELKSGEYSSGEKLAEKLGISRTSVWKWIRSLRNEGYRIDGINKKGYKLFSIPEGVFLPSEILPCKNFGQKIFYYKKVTSTQDIAKELAQRNYPEGTIIIADEQTKGRGRLDRTWTSPPGGLYFSIILRPKFSPSEVTKLNITASTAVAVSLNKLYGLNAKTKWPNDVLVNNKKLCGILIEMESETDTIRWVVLGIGINLESTPKVTGFIQSTSVRDSLKRTIKISRTELITTLLQELYQRYNMCNNANIKVLLEEYKRLSCTIGKNVKVMMQYGETITGKAVDITETGALILKLTDGKKQEILSGDCIHLRN